MRRFAVLTAAGTFAAWLLLACIEDKDTLQPVVEGASGTDAGSDAPTGGDAGGSLLLNGDFELEGCPNWDTNIATTKLNKENKRTGVGACQVCVAGDSTWSVFQTVRNLEVGSYVATAQVRGLSDRSPPKVALQAIIKGASGDPVEASSTALVPPTLPFQEVTLNFTLLPNQSEVNVGFVAEPILPNTPDACFLVDDFTLRRKAP